VEEVKTSSYIEQIDEDDPRKYFDMIRVAKISYDTLQRIYKKKFPESNQYKKLVLLLHDNVIEFNFMSQAGLLREDE